MDAAFARKSACWRFFTCEYKNQSRQPKCHYGLCLDIQVLHAVELCCISTCRLTHRELSVAVNGAFFFFTVFDLGHVANSPPTIHAAPQHSTSFESIKSSHATHNPGYANRHFRVINLNTISEIPDLRVVISISHMLDIDNEIATGNDKSLVHRECCRLAPCL